MTKSYTQIIMLHPQTAKSIHAGIIKDVARNLEREETKMKFSYDIDY